MQKIKDFVKRRKYLLIILCVTAVIALLIFKKNNGVVESYTVTRGDVKEQVALSGKVETSAQADLGFANSGRISRIYVKNSQNVYEGQILAQLEIGDILADLAIKEAGLRTTNVDLEAARENLETVTAQENAKVENAYRKLLTEDLALTPWSGNYTVTTPVVSGVYDGPEGSYKIIVRRKSITSSDFEVRTFGLEETLEDIDEEKPTPLGGRGLYISFSDDLDDYNDTIWELSIPNKSGAAYLDNYNAYIEAKKDSNLAINNAKAEYDKLLSKEQDKGLSVAQAEIQKIKAEIRKSTIYAPFSGKVTNIEKEIGENAGVGERIASVLGDGKLEAVFQVSELDVARINPGSAVSVTLDAFKEEKFEGILKTINSRETSIDGVPVYEAFVELSANEKIKSGMNAEGIIVLDERKDVLTLPARLIKTSEDGTVVKILLENGETEERKIITGLKGTDGTIEVVSGVSVGEKIVSPE